MRILIFAKKNKPGLEDVTNYLNTHYKDIITFFGVRGEKFPEKSFSYKPDILISYMSPWIIPVNLLNQTKMWNINFHPGPPNYPGIGCTNFAIYNEEKKYGVTAHLMEEKVDSGRIIGVKRFSIFKTDSAYTITVKSYGYLVALFYEVFDYIKQNKALPRCNEKWTRKPYTRKDLENLCRITLGMSKKEVRKRIKSTEFPGMPGAYIELHDYKFEYNKKR